MTKSTYHASGILILFCGNERVSRSIDIGGAPTAQLQVHSYARAYIVNIVHIMRRSRGGRGVWTPLLKNHKNIGFLSNTGPDPLKITKLPKPSFNVGLSSERCRADNAPLIMVFEFSLPSKTKKKCCQSWTPSNKTFWIRACIFT